MAWTSGLHGLSGAAYASHHLVAAHAHLDTLMLFGFVSAFATGASYFYRHRSRTAMLTFAASLAATGIYGFIEGAWPLGVLETAWAIGAARRGLFSTGRKQWHKPTFAHDLQGRQSRYREVSGSN